MDSTITCYMIPVNPSTLEYVVFKLWSQLPDSDHRNIKGVIERSWEQDGGGATGSK